MHLKEYYPGTFPRLIISVALTGAVPSKDKYPNLPVTPLEIAQEAIACASLGAQVVHLHMRDKNGKPAQERERFMETIERIREHREDLVICATTTSRGSNSLEDRLVPLDLPGALLPDMVSLTLGSYNTPYGINSNPVEQILAIANRAAERGVALEGEVFELGMIATHDRLVAENSLQPVAMMNVLLGVQGAMPASASALVEAVRNIPEGVEWAAAGIGHFQPSVTLLAAAMGGNVRVGMEDDPRGEGDGWTNAMAVRRAVEFADLIGRDLASPSEARHRMRIAR